MFLGTFVGISEALARESRKPPSIDFNDFNDFNSLFGIRIRFARNRETNDDSGFRSRSLRPADTTLQGN
jgi:hypothetical protein